MPEKRKHFTITQALLQLRYPATFETALRDWDMPEYVIRQRLDNGEKGGWLFRVNKHYSPTPDLMEYWEEEGLLL